MQDNSIQSEEVAGIAFGLDVCFLILSVSVNVVAATRIVTEITLLEMRYGDTYLTE